jgi:ABC-type branched-subunit amino acid transport system ATPase component
MNGQDSKLKLQDFAAGYGETRVLDDVNFALAKGDVLVVIGQNGSGKSTLLRTIGGLQERIDGFMSIDGRPATPRPHDLARFGVSFFTQGSLAIPALTVREHFELVLMENGGKPRETALAPIFREFPILKTMLKQRAGNLSGGERQLLSFAILLVQGTRTWLLDEPTAGLSPAAVQMTVDFLRRKNQEGMSILMVEHNMEVAFELATHIMIAKGGTLTPKFDREAFLAPGFLTDHLYS